MVPRKWFLTKEEHSLSPKTPNTTNQQKKTLYTWKTPQITAIQIRSQGHLVRKEESARSHLPEWTAVSLCAVAVGTTHLKEKLKKGVTANFIGVVS